MCDVALLVRVVNYCIFTLGNLFQAFFLSEVRVSVVVELRQVLRLTNLRHRLILIILLASTMNRGEERCRAALDAIVPATTLCIGGL